MTAQRDKGREQKERRQALEQVRGAVQDVKQRINAAENTFQTAVDDVLVESCVYELKALQARYDYLIKTARAIARGDDGGAGDTQKTRGRG